VRGRTSFVVGERYLTSEITELAAARHGYDGGSFARPKLLAVLLEIAAKRGNGSQIDPLRLGKWLNKNTNTVINGTS
jgi:hypothetical protein